MATETLVPYLPQLRMPCTCSPQVHECPACRAWQDADKRLPWMVLAVPAQDDTPPGEVARTMSHEDMQILREQIRQDKNTLRNLEKRQMRQGQLTRAEEAAMQVLATTLAHNRAIRAAYIHLSHKGKFHGAHLLD